MFAYFWHEIKTKKPKNQLNEVQFRVYDASEHVICGKKLLLFHDTKCQIKRL